ncbi:MAG: hypothetical protein ACREN6_01345 [Gemmatimonadaceae bacterium]
MNRLVRPMLAIGSLVVATACGDPYAATNPYDPATPVAFTITGPDTLFSLGEQGHYTVQTNPALPDTAFKWAVDTATIVRPGVGETVVDGATILSPGGSGSFTSLAPPLEPATVTVAIEALVGSVDTTESRFIGNQTVIVQTTVPRHIGYKSVVLMQRLTRIQLRCPATHACDTLSAGGTWSVWVDGFDALNRQIVALTGPLANPLTGTPVVTYVVRDTTIALASPVGIRVANVSALKSGTTWIVATRGALRDSLQLVVQ